MTLIKTALAAIAVASGLTAAIVGMGGAALASADPPPPPPAPVQGEEPPGLGAAEAHRGLERAPRRVELGLGRPLGRVDQRWLPHTVVKPCHRRRLNPVTQLRPEIVGP